MRVLALDLATRTGWASDYGPFLGSGFPVTGLYTLSDVNRGHAFLGFNKWLYNKVESLGDIDMIAYEKPLFGGKGVKMREAIVMKLVGLAAMAEMIGASRSIRVESVSVQVVRKAFLGQGRPANPKRAVLHRCAMLNWGTADDDNRADAAALWFWAKSNFDPKFNIEPGGPVSESAA